MIKLVRRTDPSTQFFEDANASRITAAKFDGDIYTAVSVEGYWKWVKLAATYTSRGKWSNLIELLNNTSDTVKGIYQFEDADEFKKWLKENL